MKIQNLALALSLFYSNSTISQNKLCDVDYFTLEGKILTKTLIRNIDDELQLTVETKFGKKLFILHPQDLAHSYLDKTNIGNLMGISVDSCLYDQTSFQYYLTKDNIIFPK